MDPDQVLAPQPRSPAAPPQAINDFTRALLGGAYGVMQHLGQLPQRAFEASEGLRQMGQYNPAPIVETASMLMGGGMPMAEAGAAGIFGGRLARGANHEALMDAHMLEGAGHDPRTILGATGWWRGQDGKWRFEIPDNKASLASELSGKPILGNYLQHPELYNRYPQLHDMQIGFDPTLAPGDANFFPSLKKFQFATRESPDDLRVALHEAQHGVQGIERFAQGTSLRANKGDIGAYFRSPGEVEARNVEARASLTPRERLGIPPWATEDVAQALQGKPSFSTDQSSALGLKFMGHGAGGQKQFDMINEQGHPVGHIRATEEKPGHVYVDDIWSHGTQPNVLGTSNIRSLIQALKGEFPGMQSISGARVSGARKQNPDWLRMPDAKVKVK